MSFSMKANGFFLPERISALQKKLPESLTLRETGNHLRHFRKELPQELIDPGAGERLVVRENAARSDFNLRRVFAVHELELSARQAVGNGRGLNERLGDAEFKLTVLRNARLRRRFMAKRSRKVRGFALRFIRRRRASRRFRSSGTHRARGRARASRRAGRAPQLRRPPSPLQ